MGKNSKARRDAKAKRRQAPRRGPSTTRAVEDEHATHVRAHELWGEVQRASPPQTQRIVDELAGLPVDVVETSLIHHLRYNTDWLWQHGWQPVEVVRQARRVNALTARLVEITIAADHNGRGAQRLDPRWATQLVDIRRRAAPIGDRWASRWGADEKLDRRGWLSAAATALNTIGSLRPVDCLIPPPGASPSVKVAGPSERAATGHPMLDRVRKLLAKAEATDFEEEAATFTAKAQELMTRHAIDEALLHQSVRTDAPVMIRVPIDAPYADAKSLLLAVVAAPNRCRAVFVPSIAASTVVGHAEDLAAVEMLFTSLLVQAQNALAHAGKTSVTGRTRSASYRSSFYIGFAHRIGERLIAANVDVVATADKRALPALRDRERAVEDFVDERYGDTLVASGIRGGYDPLGQAHGRVAAEDAALITGQIAG